MDDPHPTPCDDKRRLERANYFTGMVLTERDFTVEQSYFLDKHRAHNRLLHGSGVVCGLGVVPTEPPSGSVVVMPGVAIDCCGRELVLTDPMEGNLSEVVADQGGYGRVHLTIEYDEQGTEPLPVVGDEHPDEADTREPSRIREGVRIEATVHPPLPHPPHPAVHGVVPCPPCRDARLTLAAVDVTPEKRITGRAIDTDIRTAVGAPHAAIVSEIDAIRRRLDRLEAVLAASVTGAVLVHLLGRRRHHP